MLQHTLQTNEGNRVQQLQKPGGKTTTEKPQESYFEACYIPFGWFRTKHLTLVHASL